MMPAKLELEQIRDLERDLEAYNEHWRIKEGPASPTTVDETAADTAVSDPIDLAEELMRRLAREREDAVRDTAARQLREVDERTDLWFQALRQTADPLEPVVDALYRTCRETAELRDDRFFQGPEPLVREYLKEATVALYHAILRQRPDALKGLDRARFQIKWGPKLSTALLRWEGEQDDEDDALDLMVEARNLFRSLGKAASRSAPGFAKAFATALHQGIAVLPKLTCVARSERTAVFQWEAQPLRLAPSPIDEIKQTIEDVQRTIDEEISADEAPNLAAPLQEAIEIAAWRERRNRYPRPLPLPAAAVAKVAGAADNLVGLLNRHTSGSSALARSSVGEGLQKVSSAIMRSSRSTTA